MTFAFSRAGADPSNRLCPQGAAELNVNQAAGAVWSEDESRWLRLTPFPACRPRRVGQEVGFGQRARRPTRPWRSP